MLRQHLKTIIHNAPNWAYENRYLLTLLAAVAIYTGTMTNLTYLKYYCFKSYAFDMGIAIQIFWNTIKGRPMYTQPRGNLLHPSNFFGVHFSPFLYFLMPFFRIYPSVKTILFLQSFFLAVTSIVLYYIGLHLFKDERKSLLFAMLFLVYPGTLWSNWYDFHLEAFIPLPTALVYYNYLKENRVGLLASLLLLVSVLERNVFIAIAFTGYITVREIYTRKTRDQSNKTANILLITVILIASIVYFQYSEAYINSYAVDRSPSTLNSIIGNTTYTAILSKIAYITFLSAPLIFLQLDAPLELIPAGPYLALVALTGYSPYYEITWQYPALVSVPFFVSAIMAAARNPPKNLYPKIIGFSVTFFLLFSPGAPLMARLSTSWQLSALSEEIYLKHEALDTIPGNATVLAQENLFPNLAMRRTIYSYYPVNLTLPEYIVLDTKSYWLYREPEELPLEDYILQHNESYGVYAYVDSLIILRQNYTISPVFSEELRFPLDTSEARTRFISFEQNFPEAKYFIPEWVKVEPDGLHIESWYNCSIWWGPYILLPPGEYTVNIMLETETIIEEPILTVKALSIPRRTYQTWNITANQTHHSEALNLTLTEWVPEFEIVGINHGNANYTITRIELVGRYG